ncbi:MAG TPA: hypothetical protein V6C65_10915 [Allocoleopsis sp.]
MNPNSYRGVQVNLSGLRFWLTLLLIVWLLSSIGLGWLVKFSFIVLALLIVIPIVGFLAFRWWLQRNLVSDHCPVCGYETAGINNTQLRCPNCSEPLKIEKGHFVRLTPPGTVDVEAIEVPSRQLED